MTKQTENPFAGLDGEISRSQAAKAERKKKEVARLNELLRPHDKMIRDNLKKMAEAMGWHYREDLVESYPKDFGWAFPAVKKDYFAGVILLELVPLGNDHFYHTQDYPLFENGLPTLSYFTIKMKNMPDSHWMPGNPGHAYYDQEHYSKGTSDDSSEKAFIKTLHSVVKDYELRYGRRD